MSKSETDPVKHRMTRQARTGGDARAPSPARALRLALEKSGDRLFGLALSVGTLEQSRIARPALGGEAGTGDLLVLLDGADGARAAAIFDPFLVRALIEVQTTGRVRAGADAGGGRLFTDTDAAIIAPLIDAVMAGLDDALAEAHPHCSPARFRFGDRVADSRALMLALDAPEFEVFRITTDIAGGAATGAMTLALPPEATAAPAALAGGRGGAQRVSLAEIATRAPARLDAVLMRVRLSLAEAGVLRPGMTLAVGPEALERTELVAPGGRVAARARLGQVNGFRAVRLCSPDDAAAEPVAASGVHSALPGPTVAAAPKDGETSPAPPQLADAGTPEDAPEAPDRPEPVPAD